MTNLRQTLVCGGIQCRIEPYTWVLRIAALSVAVALSSCSGLIRGRDSDDGSGEPSGGLVNDPAARRVSVGPAVGRRLTHDEYFNSLEVLLGVELDPSAFELQRETNSRGFFRNDAESVAFRSDQAEAYEAIARSAAEQVSIDSLVRTHASCQDHRPECYRSFIDSLGRLIMRAPVVDAERGLFERIFDVVRGEGGPFETGARLVLEAMLQSPRFIYRLELQQGSAKTREIDDYELATRLAFLVWNAVPDAELIQVATQGDLRSKLEDQFERLWSDGRRSRRALRQYIEQWLRLDAGGAGALNDDMREETYRLFERLEWDQNQGVLEALTAKRTELSGRLAEFYGIASQGAEFDVYDLADQPERIGFLTHAAVIAGNTNFAPTSIIDRGLFVYSSLFCRFISIPEDDATVALIEEQTVPPDSRLSQRERLARQRENELCASCHGQFDPLGFAFDPYDSAGGYRTEDEFGNALRSQGEVSFGDVQFSYANVEEFAQNIAARPEVAECIAEKSLQHGFGRRLLGQDRDLIAEVFSGAKGELNWKNLLRTIAMHPEFALVEVAGDVKSAEVAK